MGKKKHAKTKKEKRTALAAPESQIEELLVEDPLLVIANAKTTIDKNQSIIESSIRAARTAGNTWPQIGNALGVSAQAAQQRYGRTSDQVQEEHSSPRAVTPVSTSQAEPISVAQENLSLVSSVEPATAPGVTAALAHEARLTPASQVADTSIDDETELVVEATHGSEEPSPRHLD